MYAEKSAWDDIADNASGVEGAHLKCAKGRWLLDDEPIDVGPSGIRLVVIMPSAVSGKVLWLDGRIAEREIGLIAQGFRPDRKLPDKWSPYLSLLGVRADEGHVGELLTFTSSSWGAWFTFEKLARVYRRVKLRQLPIVTLSTRERGDTNHNIDPVFTFAGWANPGDFPDLIAAEEQQPPNVIPFERRPALPPATNETIDDDIPF